ncbi:hypothetical protein Taro_023155, partial [Colocasia esculenta]|nr:hypothetical protein [Colocasia esculenta]
MGMEEVCSSSSSSSSCRSSFSSHRQVVAEEHRSSEEEDLWTEKGINLQKLAAWTTREIPRAEDDTRLEKVMRGFAICMAGALLFPSIHNVLEEDQLIVVYGIWKGKILGPAVLAFLYSGLMAASLVPLLTRDLRTRLAPGVDLWLIGASEFVLYNPHRSLSQLGLPRCNFEGPSHISPIKRQEIKTNNDGEEADTIKALWKVCSLRRPVPHVEEVEDE